MTFEKEPAGDTVSILKKLPGVRAVKEGTNGAGKRTITILPERAGNILATVVKETEKNNWQVSDLRLEAGQLDEVFRTITQ